MLRKKKSMATSGTSVNEWIVTTTDPIVNFNGYRLRCCVKEQHSIEHFCSLATRDKNYEGDKIQGYLKGASLTKTRLSPSSGRFFPSARMSNLHEVPGPRRRDTHKIPFSWAISNRTAEFGISFELQNTASLLGSRLEILTA